MAEEKPVAPEARYTREALAASAKYRSCCDALMIIEKFNGKPVVEATVGKE